MKNIKTLYRIIICILTVAIIAELLLADQYPVLEEYERYLYIAWDICFVIYVIKEIKDWKK
jgi:hypothetical protein